MRQPLRAMLAAAVLVILPAGPALAATCADAPVQARGDASRFETLAKAKARANWRARIRSMPALGAPYADWSKAIGADYRCTQQNGQHRCIAIAQPCRS